jgi:hypothetical protein
MFHRTITLARSGAIIADLDVTRDRVDMQLYTVEGWHPDLGRVVLIEGDEGALLISEIPLPENPGELEDGAPVSAASKEGRRVPVPARTSILLPGRRSQEVRLESAPAG